MAVIVSADDRVPDAEVGQRDRILRRLGRQQSTAAVLFNHAVAERLGLGPTDHKCLDLLLDRGPMSGTELAALSGLTTGAITGVAARLERAGFLGRSPDPADGRKQVLEPTAKCAEIEDVFAPLHQDVRRLLDRFDEHQLAAVAEFLAESSQCLWQHAALLRARGHAREEQ